MKRLLICVTLAVLMSACDGTGTSPMLVPPIPTAPLPTPAPSVPHTLSGVVFEVVSDERVPVRNVEVYCDACGSERGHTFVDTDVEGRYSFGWSYDGIIRLIVSKEGYRVVRPTATSGAIEFIDATVSGDTRFDIEIARR